MSKKKNLKLRTKKKIKISKVSEERRILKQKPQRLDIVVRSESIIPTTHNLAEPMRNGKKLTIPKTWLSDKQLLFMLQRTPREQIYRRPGKGGKTFDYVTVSYMQKALNYVFAWNWDFEIIEHGKEADHVWVLGKLTVRGSALGEVITKTQFGRSDVKKLKRGGNVDYGNDLKSAASDSLKKCCSLLGFASDIYGKTEYRQESGNEPREVDTPIAPENIEYPEPIYVCTSCKNEISETENNYSLKVFKKSLCRNCQ